MRRITTGILILGICILHADKNKDVILAQDTPKTVIIDKLSKDYGPAKFPHSRHISEVGDCAKCHHFYDGTGKPPACNLCHQVPIKNVSGLQNAYHRQCIKCHAKTGAPIGCTDCHSKGGIRKVQEKPKTIPEICIIGEIAKKYNPVKFSHQAHIKIAGNCERCHHSGSHQSHAKISGNCEKCHQYCPNIPYKCAECHKDPKKLDMVGLKGAYHQQCRNCHKGMKGPVGCNECHQPQKQKGKEK